MEQRIEWHVGLAARDGPGRMAVKAEGGLTPAPGRRRRRWFTAIATLTGLALALASAELLLRMTGYSSLDQCADADEPVIYEPDALLGWKPRAGAYVIPGRNPQAPTTEMTILPDGSRASGNGRSDAGLPVVLVGCSFTQGVGISDADTFAWKLQERFPSWHVRNFGTGAYSTYQALLLLERVFAQPDPPQRVFYGFIEPHEMRNIAHPVWLHMLALCSRRGMVYTPYCTLDDAGQLVHHPPESYWLWPLQRYLASASFLQDRYAEYQSSGRTAQARQVTEQLLLDMDRLSKQHGARLTVVLLYHSPQGKAHYAEFLSQHGVEVVDCAFPITRDMTVPGEGHPNGALNTRWASCIASKVESE